VPDDGPARLLVALAKHGLPPEYRKVAAALVLELNELCGEAE
jgi:hypothetical protein